MHTFARSSARPGIHRLDECCTHPSDALVIINAFPFWMACCNKVLTMRSKEASCSRTWDGMAPNWRCTISRWLVQRRVSSQSKMVTVCDCFGRLSCGMNAREFSSFLM